MSQWGHDFRPEYLGLGDAIDALGRPPVLALTATATQDVIDDILRQLHIPEAEVVHTGFYRPNIDQAVLPVPDEKERLTKLVRLLGELEGTGIVYTATVKAVNELVEHFEGCGLAVAAYHGRLKAAVRAENQDRFMRGEIKAIVATNAFGLGIDKPDIRFVIHHHMPGTIEAYYQEFGRAGRDGRPARSILLYRPADRKLQAFLKSGSAPTGEELVNVHHALKRLARSAVPGAGPTFAELKTISPVGPTRLKMIVAQFKRRGIISETSDRRLRLDQPDLSPDDLQRIGRTARERDEAAQLKLQQMVNYAELRSCRWTYLLQYFGQDDAPFTACGHCDNCRANPGCRIADSGVSRCLLPV